MCPAQVYEVGEGNGDGTVEVQVNAVELRPVRRDHRQGRPADPARGRLGAGVQRAQRTGPRAQSARSPCRVPAPRWRRRPRLLQADGSRTRGNRGPTRPPSLTTPWGGITPSPETRDRHELVQARRRSSSARETIGGRLHRTPTFSSATLSRAHRRRVHLKAELFQRTGLVQAARRADEARVAQRRREAARRDRHLRRQPRAGARLRAALEGIDALVVMWQGASEQKIAATRGYGAEVDLEAPTRPRRSSGSTELLEETGRTLVHPFDDPLVMAGQGTVGLELVEDVAGRERRRRADRRRRPDLRDRDRRQGTQPRRARRRRRARSSPTRCTRASRPASASR